MCDRRCSRAEPPSRSSCSVLRKGLGPAIAPKTRPAFSIADAPYAAPGLFNMAFPRRPECRPASIRPPREGLIVSLDDAIRHALTVEFGP